MNSIFFQANQKFIQNKYDEAIGFYLKSIEENQKFYCSHENLSQAYLKSNDFLRARISYIQAQIYKMQEEGGFKLPYWWNRKRECVNIDKNTVLVIIPVFNSEKTLQECLNSVFQQRYKNIVVVAINDNSTDKSLEILKRFSKTRENFFLIDSIENNGPFVSVNIGLMLFEAENYGFFIKHDADDIMLEDKIEKQIKVLHNNDALKLCTAGYSRVGFDSGIDFQGKNRGHNMTLYKREVFDAIGFFDSNRFGSDSEYLNRALNKFGKEVEFNIPERLTKAYAMEGSGINITTANPLGSSARKKYMENYKWVHEKNKIVGSWYYEFDRTKISSLSKVRNVQKYSESIVCGMATIKLRRKAVEEAINSILPQLDLLIVYQNDYKDITGIFDNEKIKVISALDTGIDMGDAGKFFEAENVENSYYFSCDDDLIYPADYVKRMVEYLKENNNDIIVSCHGAVMKNNPDRFYSQRKKVFHFGREVGANEFCHFGGTGVMAFHTNRLKLNFNMFRLPNMADIWIGLLAKERGIPIGVLPHNADWISHSQSFDVDTTIYRSRDNNAITAQDLLVTGMNFGSVLAYKKGDTYLIENIDTSSKNIKERKKIAVGIPTFNRNELVKILMEKLNAAASAGFDVYVIMHDDGSLTPVEFSSLDLKNIKSLSIERSINNGKKKYWKTVNSIFKRLEEVRADYYFYLSDDIEVEQDFFVEAISVWDSIKDNKKISLNLLNDGREQCWTNVKRKEVANGAVDLYKTQWLDMLIMFDKNLLKYKLDEIPLSRWNKNPNLSSGVGAQLSTRLHEEGYAMYQVKKSLIFHGDHLSQMNPEERLKNPLVSQ